MYHSVIGKRLVACINLRNGTKYTVREFFDEVYVPLFFANSRLLQHVNNSPFAQEFTTQKKAFTIALRDECLWRVHQKVQNEEPDASFFLGGPASNTTDGTSGQVTALKIPISEEDVYASWIGAALGLTVGGGYTLLIEADDVLMTTYEGWGAYRRFLDQSPKVKPLQINAWNGQWVASRMAKSIFFEPKVDKDGAALEMQPWVQLVFALSYHYRDGPMARLLAYVYSLGQSNTTLGFVQFNLPDVKRLVDLYNQLFSVPAGMPAARFEALYQTEGTFRTACTHTEIGLRTLKPTDTFNAQKGIPKPPNVADSEKQIAFDTYQTWIIAMLNNKELLQRAEELAAALDNFRKKDERGKVVYKQMIEDLLDKKNRRDFIDALTKLLEKDGSNCELFERAVGEILSLSPDNVPLFLTLLRFKYAAVRAKV